jgi:hypothetical protein
MIRPIKLGELIKQLSTCNPDAQVRFDFGDLRPTILRSYRGYYDQLALDWDAETVTTVADLLEECRQAVRKVYEGYKGGEFEMDESTPVWVSRYGRASGTAIKGVKDFEHYVVITTRYIE